MRIRSLKIQIEINNGLEWETCVYLSWNLPCNRPPLHWVDSNWPHLCFQSMSIAAVELLSTDRNANVSFPILDFLFHLILKHCILLIWISFIIKGKGEGETDLWHLTCVRGILHCVKSMKKRFDRSLDPDSYPRINFSVHAVKVSYRNWSIARICSKCSEWERHMPRWFVGFDFGTL